MKRVLLLSSLIVMMAILTACGASKAYDFNGDWYSAKDGYLYVFTDGDVFCEENYVTLDSGKKTSGGYYEHENYIEAYIIETIGAGEDVSPLYLIQGEETDMLCSDLEGNNVFFCRSIEVAQQIVQQREEEQEREKEQLETEKRNSAYMAPTVSYDSAISGEYTYEFVSIEGFVTSYEYSNLINWYDFDFWCWSDQQNAYVCKKVSLGADKYTEDDVLQLQKFNSGDKIKFVFEVKPDIDSDWISIPRYLYAELIENGDISESELNDGSIIGQTGVSSGVSTASTSDIAVRFEPDYIDGDRLHITVFTKNNSDEKFSGNVYVTFYSADGKDRLGSDTIIVEELLPGRESWTDIVVDAYRGTPKMAVDFSEVSFVPIKEVSAEIDAEATDKTKNSFRLNFDGVSWYDDVTDIVVYTDGTCIVTIKDNPKEGGQFYASTVESCGEDYGVKEVQVVDQTGKIIAVY